MPPNANSLPRECDALVRESLRALRKTSSDKPEREYGPRVGLSCKHSPGEFDYGDVIFLRRDDRVDGLTR